MKKAAIFLCFMLCAALPAYAASEQKQLIPVGQAVGIEMQSDGVLVVGFAGIQQVNPAQQAGIQPGDIITSIDGDNISSCEDVKNAVEKMDGSSVNVKLTRGENDMEVTVTPAVLNGKCELGMWLRDGITGIGTVTYYDPDTGSFGSLGHSITDLDTGVMLPLSDGDIYSSTITGVIKGQCGTPGQLVGNFDANNIIGSLSSNTQYGLFGTMDVPFEGERVYTAQAGDVHTGEASIFSNIAGEEVKEYSIEISRIYSGLGQHGMMITVTDEELLAATGGIVQGMSGSPIIQDGKLVGAVTHVLVNDPTRGYGIFIDSMLDAAA
jgi:stage IV sporulation protein B